MFNRLIDVFCTSWYYIILASCLFLFLRAMWMSNYDGAAAWSALFMCGMHERALERRPT